MAALATVGELETHLGRSVDDVQAQQMLDLSSAAVRAYCGWNVTREDTTFYFEGNGTGSVSLPTLELIEVHQVRANGAVLDTTKWPIIWSRKGQGSIGRWHGNPGQWQGSIGGWPRGVQYAVDLTHGYDPVPDLLKLVTLDLAARQISNPQSLVSATVGQVSRTWATGSTGDPQAMSSLHERLLDRYRL